MNENRLEINCSHGKGIAYIVYCHHLNSIDPVGFIENSSAPNDLQGWCYACEYLYEREGERTEKLIKFHNPKMVCEKCKFIKNSGEGIIRIRDIPIRYTWGRKDRQGGHFSKFYASTGSFFVALPAATHRRISKSVLLL